jgi:Immunity protein 50
MNDYEEFEESAHVTSWFGHWPSLHDAEILSVDFQRAVTCNSPGVFVKVHAFEMTSEVDEKGYYKLVKHCIIDFRFDQIDDVALRWFGHQNVIGGISLSPASTKDGARRIAVEFESITGVELSFSCARAVVVRLTPGLPTEGVYTRDRW